MSDFAENLIKGRIVEAIFQQMFLDTKKYNVFPFGYEQTLPQLAQADHDAFVRSLIKDIRHIPDFVVTPRYGDGVYLVEVKYEHTLDMQRVVEVAQELYGRWACPWLFVASQENFYFDSCSDILSNNELKVLSSEKWVSEEMQQYYLELLSNYIKA